MATILEPVPTYAEVSISRTDPRTGEVKSQFNPVWLSWFLKQQQKIGGAVDLANEVVGVLPTGYGGTGVDIATYFTGTITLAALSGGGTQGTLDIINGLIASAVPPT